MSIYSEETRLIYGTGFQRPLVATLAHNVSESALRQRYSDGFLSYYHSFAGGPVRPESLTQLLARVVLTGSPLPPFGVQSGGGALPITRDAQLRLSVQLCQLEAFPVTTEHNETYLKARSVIEKAIGFEHIHLEVPEVRHEYEKEGGYSVQTLTDQLSNFQFAFASSPELTNLSLPQLLANAKSMITAFGSPATAVSATAGLVAISDLYAHDFQAAFSVALAGTSIALIFRFSDYAGRIFRLAEREQDLHSTTSLTAHEFSGDDLGLQQSRVALAESIEQVLQSGTDEHTLGAVQALINAQYNGAGNYHINASCIPQHKEEAEVLYNHLIAQLLSLPSHQHQGEIASALGTMKNNMLSRINTLRTTDNA